MKKTWLNVFSILMLFPGVALPSEADIAKNLVAAKPAFRHVFLTGFTRAYARLPIIAETTGKVLRVNGEIGDRINDNGSFADLDPTFIRLDLEANRVQQEKTRSRIDYNQREARRYQELIRKGNASKSQMDSLEQTLQDSRLQLDELEVNEKILMERLKRSKVKVPIGWLITRRDIQPGQRVHEGEILGEVGDFSRLLVPFSLSPVQFAALQNLDNKFQVELPDWNKTVGADINRINPGFDPETRKINVELELSAELPHMRGGLRVRLGLLLPERTGAIFLPREAIEESYDEFWVTRKNGERIQVVLLGTNGNESLLKVAAPGLRSGDLFQFIKRD